jgi:hypothetical protein
MVPDFVIILDMFWGNNPCILKFQIQLFGSDINSVFFQIEIKINKMWT